jgi:hypothetical protein
VQIQERKEYQSIASQKPVPFEFDAGTMPTRCWISPRLVAAGILLTSSAYFTYQSHEMISMVTESMKSTLPPHTIKSSNNDDDTPTDDDNIVHNPDDNLLSTDTTSYYNTTHIACLFKDTSNSTWHQQIVPMHEFWSTKKCRFRLGRDTIYFHQGKAGGGTVNYLGQKYHLGLRTDHPTIQDGSIADLMNGPLTTLLFTLRDPVDRFVSMFHWRLLTLCHPGDTRKESMSKTTTLHNETVRNAHATRPDRYCLATRAEQEKTLRVTYNGDPNTMAEALCLDSPNYQQAVRDVTDINHSTTIAQWLELLIDPMMVRNITSTGLQNFVVVPLTPSFESDIEALFSELLRKRYGNDILDTMPSTDENDKHIKKKKKLLSHSSQKHVKGKNKPGQLTDLAECCLTRYYQRDYQVIQSMLGNEEDAIFKTIDGAHPVIATACDWGDHSQRESCKAALQSMIMKRKLYYMLPGKDQSCSELVNGVW